MSDGASYPVPGARHRTQETIERRRFVCTITRVSLHSGVGDIAALATLPRIEWVDLTILLKYTSIATVRRLLPAYEAELVSEEYGNDVHFHLRVPASQTVSLQSALLDATQGQMRVVGPDK